MQIDFHHAVTYVVARLSGFKEKKANIIAYAAQYVDDATSDGTVHFSNNAMFNRISSAHAMTDPNNFKKSIKNHMVWLPFHFLPGNGDKEAGKNPNGGFINKIVCSKNSPIAKEMVRQAIIEKDKPYGLHRLGITMHVYADTWAHQKFAGVLHDINEVEDAVEKSDTGVFKGGLHAWCRDILDDAIPPLGHGRANIFPDMPFLSWGYQNFMGDPVEHNNTDEFCEAVDHMCIAMKRFRLDNPDDGDVTGIKTSDMKKIRALFETIKEKNGEKRHEKWLEKIKEGYFSFGSEQVSYSAKGRDSWKKQALGSNFDESVCQYSESFLTSNWKLFHDAAIAHRFYILHDLLPKYGICAA
ncbi:MAG: hypothetical protein GY857_14155 [Desulfobacula sp.]|nr:hypothetical protein [Desulfobacula sp.]